MAVTIIIPDQYRSATAGESVAHLSGETIGQILDALCGDYPPLRGKIFDETGAKRKTVNIYLNNEDTRYSQGVETAVRDGDEIIILPPASGG